MFVPLTPLEFRTRAERLFGGKVGVIDGQARFTYAEFGAGRVVWRARCWPSGCSRATSCPS